MRKAEDDRGAREAFASAWQLGGSPEALAQLALSEQALGLWLDAHEHLTAALQRSDDDWIGKHRHILETALAEMESRFGKLEITCNVPGSEVLLDGRVVGRTPLSAPLRLLAGRSVIRLSAKGHFDVTRQVQIDAGGLARLDVTLTSSAGTSTPDTTLPAPALPAHPLDAGAMLQPTSAPGARPPLLDASGRHWHDTASVPKAHDVLKYGSLGLASLGAAIGVTGYVLREINVSAYNDDSRCSVDQGRRRSEECPDAAAAWRLGEAMAIGGFTAMGVFGAVGLYLWLDTTSGADGAATACAAGLGSISCRTSF